MTISQMLRGPMVAHDTEPVIAPVIAPVVTPAAWHAGIADQAILGHVQTQGWDKLEPHAAISAAVAAWQANQSVAGVDPSRLVVMPKDVSDTEGLKAFREKLGIPADATGYDLSAFKIKDAAGTETAPPPELVDWTKATALKLGLPKDQAAALAAEIVARDATTATAKATLDAAALQSEKAKLAADWGANADVNLMVAKQAALKLGITPEAIAALEGQVGFAAVMQAMHNIGTKIGEDKWVANPNPAVPGAMSQSQAVSQKNALLSDKAFGARALAGDAAAVAQLAALDKLITGEDGSTYRAA